MLYHDEKGITEMNSIQLNNGFSSPYTVSPELKPTIDALNLNEAVNQLREQGYTTIEDAVSPELCSEVRAAIMRIAESERGGYFDIKEGQGYSAYHLFGKDPCFVQVLLNPKLLALTEFLCGGDFLLSQLSGSVRFQGAEPMALHMDAAWYPPTPYNPLFTVGLALDELTRTAGTTKIVPGTHKLMREPTLEEAINAETKGAIPVECSPGALTFWNGYTWHSNYARTMPGERVMLHLTFCRAPYRPIEDYHNISDEYLAQYPEIVATMLGRNSYFGHASHNNGACDITRYERMSNAVRR